VRPLGRSRPRYEANIKMGFKVTGWNDVDCVHQIQAKDQWSALVNTVIDL